MGDGYNHQFVIWLFQWVDTYLKNNGGVLMQSTSVSLPPTAVNSISQQQVQSTTDNNHANAETRR
jgi:hypothetical protein